MRLHRWAKREGTRGVRAFATIYGDDHAGYQRTLVDSRIEGYIASGAEHSGFGLSFDDDTAGVQLFAGLAHVACAWVAIGSPALATRVYRRWGKGLPELNVAELRFHNRAVWWELWHDKHSWSTGTPRWRHGSFHWWDWLTGKPVFSREPIEGPVEITVPMPEGGYRATVTIERCTSKRPRWPWRKVDYGYDLDVLSVPGPDGPYLPYLSDDENRNNGYIPVPGKGENAWDCGPDGVFSQSGPGRTVEAAIGQVVSGVLRERRRRGAVADYREPIT